MFHLSGFLLLLALSSAKADSKQQVAANINNFGTKLYKELPQEDGNIFFSPLSIYSTLSMEYLSANEEEAEQMQSVLNVDLKTNLEGYHDLIKSINSIEKVTIHSINKYYASDTYELSAEFKSFMSETLFTELIIYTNFEDAAKEYKNWLALNTNFKIKKIINEPFEICNGMNTIYLNGRWMETFPKESTYKDKFYISESEDIDVDMMSGMKKLNYALNNELDAEVFELKFNNPDVSMIVVTPNEKFDIEGLESKLLNYDLTALIEGMEETIVDLHLPKFKVENLIINSEPFLKVGVNTLHDSGDDYHESTSDSCQENFFEVNEEGCEVAASNIIV